MRFTRHLEVLPAFELFFKKIDQVLEIPVCLSGY